MAGPDSPKGKIDVYLQPLIDELQQLWNYGVVTYDASKKQYFRMIFLPMRCCRGGVLQED
jgi:uncharacterized protein YlbG (UPF0298 family)